MLATFLLSSVSLFSQDQNFAFAAYSNFAISNEQVQNWHPQGIEVKKSNGAYGYFSPAVLLFRENGDFQEFEISRIGFNTKEAEVYSLDSLNQFSHLVGGTSVDEIKAAVRYTYSFLIDLFEEESKLKVYLGAGASPYYLRASMRPQTSDIFPVSSSTGGIRFSAIPTLAYSISDHWFLNLNIPFTVANAFVSSTKTENPAVPISDRKSSRSDIKLFPNELHIRFGLGLRL
ncbi:hypothetical protein G3O08_14365 [Cryomorpha ignava]|uniref:Outer membrane beta-barrel protein n=1 Tax=Cryomorpha ignava TaxID=101383 RepID=A0A7K3WT25_9FLAO|nr:hypothetical protein [Cryomorpha ignava]NEN24688.1 hypothetical protein [Cryomorpha ignava]